MKDSRLFRRFTALALGVSLLAVPFSASAHAVDDVHTLHNISTMEASAAELSFAGGASLAPDKARFWDDEQLIITVQTYGSETVNAHDLVVTYDASVLALSAVRAVDSDRTYIVDASKSVPGEARIITAGAAFSGETDLVQLVFDAKASAVSEIWLSSAEAARTVNGTSEMGAMVLPSAALDIVSLSLDLNNDGRITAADLEQLGTVYRWRAAGDAVRFDLNGDGVIDVLDLAIVASQVG